MKKNISYTTSHNLCTGCGVCQSACHRNAIDMTVNKGCFEPMVYQDACNECGLCLKACPGIGMDLTGIGKNLYKDALPNKFVGQYIKCFSGYSNEYNIRYHSASGGLVSQFLIWLLENKHIDGAVVTRFETDSQLLVKTFIATTREDIVSARSSKYSPVTLNTAIQEIKNASGYRYVIVGLPCHIEGMRKLMAIDKKLREKIFGLFAIYCSSGRSFGLTEYVFREYKIDISKLTYFQYRDEGCLGAMVVKTTEGERRRKQFQSYYHPLRSFFVPSRCKLCIDHYGELADVCFGDIHIQPYIQDTVGVNSMVVRNHKFLNLLSQARKDGAITLDEIVVDVVNKSQTMARVKKYRNSAFIRFSKMLGMKVPDFGDLPKGGNNVKWFIAFIQSKGQHFIGFHKWMWWAIPMLKDKSPKE